MLLKKIWRLQCPNLKNWDSKVKKSKTNLNGTAIILDNSHAMKAALSSILIPMKKFLVESMSQNNLHRQPT